jgi:predicted amidophosphoribosyltransferase
MQIDETYDWDDGEDDYPDEEDDSTATVECPACGVDVYEEAERCPACGNYALHADDYLWKDRPIWWVVLGAIGIAAVISMLVAF